MFWIFARASLCPIFESLQRFPYVQFANLCKDVTMPNCSIFARASALAKFWIFARASMCTILEPLQGRCWAHCLSRARVSLCPVFESWQGRHYAQFLSFARATLCQMFQSLQGRRYAQFLNLCEGFRISSCWIFARASLCSIYESLQGRHDAYVQPLQRRHYAKLVVSS